MLPLTRATHFGTGLLSHTHVTHKLNSLLCCYFLLDLETLTFWIPHIFPFSQQKVKHFLLGDLQRRRLLGDANGGDRWAIKIARGSWGERPGFPRRLKHFRRMQNLLGGPEDEALDTFPQLDAKTSRGS